MLQYGQHKYPRPPLQLVSTKCVCSYSISKKHPCRATCSYLHINWEGPSPLHPNNMPAFLPPLFSISPTIRVERQHQTFKKLLRSDSTTFNCERHICNHRKLCVQSEFSRLITMSPPATNSTAAAAVTQTITLNHTHFVSSSLTATLLPQLLIPSTMAESPSCNHGCNIRWWLLFNV